MGIKGLLISTCLRRTRKQLLSTTKVSATLFVWHTYDSFTGYGTRSLRAELGNGGT